MKFNDKMELLKQRPDNLEPYLVYGEEDWTVNEHGVKKEVEYSFYIDEAHGVVSGTKVCVASERKGNGKKFKTFNVVRYHTKSTRSAMDNWDPLVGIAICKLKLDIKSESFNPLTPSLPEDWCHCGVCENARRSDTFILKGQYVGWRAVKKWAKGLLGTGIFKSLRRELDEPTTKVIDGEAQTSLVLPAS